MNNLEITNEDITLLKEMKENCLKADVYDDEKRLLKSNAITKFLMLQTENQQLKEKINQYENPDDLTLFYMWLDEKAKDKMKQLQSTLEEIREYITHEWFKRGQLGIIDKSFQEWELNNLLQIIDKGK